jgi:hypothetical protein
MDHSSLYRSSRSSRRTSRKRYRRKKKLLRDSRLSRWWVPAILSLLRVRVTFSNHKPKFDIREFLRGGLGEVPSKPDPRALNPQEVRRMKAVSWGSHAPSMTLLHLAFCSKNPPKEKVCSVLLKLRPIPDFPHPKGQTYFPPQGGWRDQMGRSRRTIRGRFAFGDL